ncbi:MAG: Na/Pi cotransporter family protein [Bianqueaceae bacterium]
MTALLSAAGANRTAKRAALIHLLFNITGTILFAVGSVLFFRFNTGFGAIPVTLTGISIFHTIFNVANTVVLFPFSKQLVHLAEKLLPEHKTAAGDEIAEEKLLKRLDERILNNPGFAIATTVEEVLKMADLTSSNLRLCQQALMERDDALVQRVFEQEDIVDRSEKEITEYLIKINEESISERQSHTVTALLHTINDIERISDHSENGGIDSELYPSRSSL